MIRGEKSPVSEGGERDRAVPWTPWDSLLGLALVAAGVAVAVATLKWLDTRSESAEITPFISLALVLLPGLMVGVMWVLGVKRYQAPWRTFGFRRPRARYSFVLPWPVLFASLGFGGLYATVIREAGVDLLMPPSLPESALGEGLLRVANVGAIAVLGPLAEEVFFRGFLLASLVQPLGPLRAAAVASAIFAASHVSIGVMIPFFVSGMLLSWLYLRTGSIWPSFMAHAAQNSLAVVAISLAPP